LKQASQTLSRVFSQITQMTPQEDGGNIGEEKQFHTPSERLFVTKLVTTREARIATQMVEQFPLTLMAITTVKQQLFNAGMKVRFTQIR